MSKTNTDKSPLMPLSLSSLDEAKAGLPPHVQLFANLALGITGVPDAPIFPEWQKNAMRRLFKTFMPTVQVREFAELFSESKSSPAVEGRFFGHLHALMLWFRERLLPTLPANERDKAQLFLSRMWPATGVQGVEMVLKEYTSADARAFFTNYAKGLAYAIDQGGPSMSSQQDSLLLAVLIFCSDKLSRLRNTTALHEFLVRGMGNNLAGSLKRVRNLCHRIGLTFPDKGGRRPKHTKTRPDGRGSRGK